MLDVMKKVRRRRRLIDGAVVGLSAAAFLLALIGAAVVMDWRFA
jgi:hypothetical protein